MEKAAATWEPGPRDPALQADCVDVWRIDLDGTSEEVERQRERLCPEELERARRFHFSRHRTRYVIAHGALRGILSRYVQIAPSEVRFRHNAHGKPFLATGSIQFNLTHSHDLALVAVTSNRKIGVDVEWIRQDIEYEQIARRFFSPIEAERLNRCPESERPSAFFHCWTRKEAWIKAKGQGFSIPLDRFHVSVDPQLENIALTVDQDEESDTQWMLCRLAPHDAYAATVAVEGMEMRLRLWDYAEVEPVLR